MSSKFIPLEQPKQIIITDIDNEGILRFFSNLEKSKDSVFDENVEVNNYDSMFSSFLNEDTLQIAVIIFAVLYFMADRISLFQKYNHRKQKYEPCMMKVLLYTIISVLIYKMYFV